MTNKVSNKSKSCRKAALRTWANRSEEERKEVGRKISLAKKKSNKTPERQKALRLQGEKHSKFMKKNYKRTGLYNQSEETLKKAARTRSRSTKLKFKNDPTYGQERIALSLKDRKLSLPEQQIKDILNLMNLPYEYTGNGRIMFGRFCPDFCRVDAKAVIDVFGYTHRRKDGKMKAFDVKRIAFIESLGYEVLIIWQEEIQHIGDVAEKIKKFDEIVLEKLLKNKQDTYKLSDVIKIMAW